jgi:RNA polymerase sigma factor (sigma-70 family)
MSSAGSVTEWIRELKAGDAAAVQKLWERYFHQLVGLARSRLQGVRRAAVDAEDVALSAFASFCDGASHGRFPRLEERDSLWSLLLIITARKVSHLLEQAYCQKRGGQPHVQMSQRDAARHDWAAVKLEEVMSREPTPEFAAEVAEQYQRLLAMLDDAELRALAVCKMEGYTNKEIAAKLGCAPRTIERRLQLIRRLWADESVR